MTTEQTKQRKPIYRTDTPFQRLQVSKLEQPHHDILVDLLVDLLQPIGVHQRSIPKSKGKRNKKRKRDSQVVDGNVEAETKPSKPTIASSVLIGFNQVTSHLEGLSGLSAPQAGLFTAPKETSEHVKPRHVAAVFLLRPMDDLIYTHLPTLCYTASLAHPNTQPTRFVLLDPSVERRLADALGCPMVSVFALLDGVEGTKVADYVQEHVGPVEASWLRQAAESRWLGVKVDVQ